ncbi:uncharacterized protein OCT59_021553 [Rhizophagus irregularis]|nr:hypothetical protein OCT59_021553 [Rhizophagus irregularis]
MDLNIEQLNILRNWPTDSAIRSCFKDSFSIAEELYNDISTNSRMIDKLDENLLSNENDIFMAINIASKQVESLSLLDDDNILELDTTDLTKQVDLIQNIQPCSSLISVNNDIHYTLSDGQINFIKMLEICTKHEAYFSRILECKCRVEQIAKNSDLIINPNKASHMVAHLINNENPETRFITQREKRWKTNRKTMAAKLAQQHKEELARNKESKNKKKRNVNSVICETMYYYEVYNYHAYHEGEVTDLDNLSYITLHVFLPIHHNIFSGLTIEKSKIFTHRHPDNIVYYLANMDVVVTENSLSLKGFGKIIYNYFNCEEIKAAIVV